MQTHDIVERFIRLEDWVEAYGLGRQPVYVAGSAALLLQGYLDGSRMTNDIDLIYCSPEIAGIVGALDMNNDVNTFEWQFPAGWQLRAVKMPLDTLDVEVYVVSVPDIVLSKLVSARELDLDDVAALDAEGAIN